MHHCISNSTQLLITNLPGTTVVSDGQSERLLAPLVRTAYLTELAFAERHTTARYSIERLAPELQRQSQIIAKKGGVTAEEKSRLRSLTLDCMTKLQLVNVQLNDRLLEILSR